MAPTACAVCGKGPTAWRDGGSLDPYRDVAQANGWTHEYAHLDCARYKVPTIVVAANLPRAARSVA